MVKCQQRDEQDIENNQQQRDEIEQDAESRPELEQITRDDGDPTKPVRREAEAPPSRLPIRTGMVTPTTNTPRPVAMIVEPEWQLDDRIAPCGPILYPRRYQRSAPEAQIGNVLRQVLERPRKHHSHNANTRRPRSAGCWANQFRG